VSETSQSVVNAAAAGGGSMRSFKKFRDYALQSHNKSKEKAGGDPNLQHLLQPTPELDEVTRGFQVVQGLQRRYKGLVSVSSQVSSCAYGACTHWRSNQALRAITKFLHNIVLTCGSRLFCSMSNLYYHDYLWLLQNFLLQ
jgi:hypothetical protein